jgi:hypothetical protein
LVSEHEVAALTRSGATWFLWQIFKRIGGGGGQTRQSLDVPSSAGRSCSCKRAVGVCCVAGNIWHKVDCVFLNNDIDT